MSAVDIKTIFLDIDGCLVKHSGSTLQQIESMPELLPGVREKLLEWEHAGAVLILITGRRESLRCVTEEMLLYLGIAYNMLIMNLPRGPRVVINDMKPTTTSPTALAWSPKRNQGLQDCPY